MSFFNTTWDESFGLFAGREQELSVSVEGENLNPSFSITTTIIN